LQENIHNTQGNAIVNQKKIYLNRKALYWKGERIDWNKNGEVKNIFALMLMWRDLKEEIRDNFEIVKRPWV
jgi:hypothetical protein